MEILSIDVETFSSISLKKCGVHNYVESPDFEIMLFGYSFDDEPAYCIDLMNWEQLPMRVMEALTDPLVKKTAWKADFEIACIEKHFKMVMVLSQWECTMSKAAMYGFPLKLEKCAEAMKLTELKKQGRPLLRYFTQPCTVKAKRTRNYPHHKPEWWEDFKAYDIQDVVVEKTVGKRLASLPFPESEKKIWALDQKINARGITADKVFIHECIKMNDTFQARMTARAIELTGLENPNSLAQLKGWLTEEEPDNIIGFKKLDKEAIINLIESGGPNGIESDVALEVLKIRQAMGKTSVGKYYTMLEMMGPEDRVRDQFQYYGAGTGRWAGRGTQPHNLPKNYLPDLKLARELVREGKMDIVEMLFGTPPGVLSELIRTAFIPKPGHKLIIGDFSQIEARIISWIAREKWRLDTFEKGIDIYSAGGSQMFRLPLSEVGKGSKAREKAKIAELALGFQGSVGALMKMGGAKMGLSETEMQEIVYAWRNANPKIKQLWYDVQEAAIYCVSERQRTSTHGLGFFMVKDILFMRLHSGRMLAYPYPRIYTGKYGPALAHEGLIDGNKKWGVIQTYGGKLVENAVQGEARDLLAEAMVRVETAGYPICLHVHDELAVEVLKYVNCKDNIEALMSVVPEWAKGLPMKADLFEHEFYKKE